MRGDPGSEDGGGSGAFLGAGLWNEVTRGSRQRTREEEEFVVVTTIVLVRVEEEEEEEVMLEDRSDIEFMKRSLKLGI